MGVEVQDFHVEAIEPSEGCAILQVKGEVDVYTAPMLRERMLDLVAKGAVHIILDLRGVAFLDSTGLGVLVGGLKRVRAHDGSLTLVLEAERILRIFRITGLDGVFPPHPSVPQAVAAEPHWRRTAESEAGTVDDWCRQHALT
jgi:anti-sigma B factor antagonist